jgi:lysozyme family protein
MNSFDDAFDVLMKSEGGYSNNPRDAGGETMYGITKRVAVSNGYDGAMKDLPLSTAKAIAKSQYWDKYLCDQFDPRIGFQVFDAAYNGGHPAKWLQQAVCANPDGAIGAQTIAAVRSSDPLKVVMRFLSYRLKYLGNLASWQDFGHGWANRVADNLIKGAE